MEQILTLYSRYLLDGPYTCIGGTCTRRNSDSAERLGHVLYSKLVL